MHSSFTVALSEGKARFNFAWRENREFWLASWRYISNLGQRGTWRTAYEWAKLLLSLDPDKDPYCVGLILDQLALRGGQADHFLRLSQCSLSQRQWRDFPNVHISSALAQLKAKEAANCRLSLAKAVKKYPWIFTRLFQELNIENIPKSIWGNEPRSQREKLDCEMYVTAAKDLWNTPDAISFLKEVTESVTVDYLPPIQKSAISIDEARHVLISGNPALIGLIPRSFTNTSTSPSDPLPPPDSMTSYDATPPTDHESNPQNFLPLFLFADLPGLAPEFEPQDIASRSVEERAEDVQELRGLQAFFSRLIPWIAPSLADDVTDQEGTDEPRGPLQEQNFSAVASGSGPPQEQVAARGIRLIELLRRTLGREPRPGELFPATVATNDNELGGASDLENIGYLEYDTANDDELGETSDLENTGYLEHDTSPSASSPPSPTRPHIDTPERAPKAVQEPYDDDRNQRWLAGRGMLGLRDFVAIHSADEAAWSSDSTIANKGQELLTEYAKRVSLLQQERTRRFIVDYVLPQGTSGEVRDLVLRYMHTLRE